MATAVDWTNEDKENDSPNLDPLETLDPDKKNQPDAENNAKEQRKRGRKPKSTVEAKQIDAEELMKRIRELEDENKSIKKEYDHELSVVANEKKQLQKVHDREMSVVRMKLQEKEQELADETGVFRRKLGELQDENLSLLEDLANKSAELERVQTILKENETDYNDLLAQMTDQQDKVTLQTPAVKPKGVAVVDGITAPLEALLPPEVEWNVVNLSPKEAVVYFNDQAPPDLALLMTGVNEISAGRPGLDCFSSIQSIVDKLTSNNCHVALLQLPPQSATNQINMFNLKASKSDAQFLKWDTRAAPKSELIGFDGSLLTKCIELIGSTLKAIKIPKARKEENSPKTVNSTSPYKQVDVNCIVDIEKANIGKLIGRGGRTIKQISIDHGVKLSIGQWIEAKKEYREDVKDLLTGKCDKLTDAVIVIGELTNVQEAIRVINLSLSNEPPTKKHKF